MTLVHHHAPRKGKRRIDWTANTNKQNILNKIVAKGKSAPDAIAWYKTACDPFHDYDVGINGIPDIDGQPSVVQIVPKVLSVTAPAGLNAGETWSLHITTLPLAQTLAVSSYTTTNSYGGFAEGGDNGQYGVLGTYSLISHGDGAGGNSSFPDNTTPSYYDPTRAFRAISIDDVGDSSLKKLIAGGFEVQ